ncbi:MAG: hypothetical protein AAGF74_09655 [Pseudomonadota bacterium]
MKRFLSALAVLAATAPAALAQTYCADRTDVTERLTAKWGEVFSGGGLQNATAVIEVWTNDAEGTWTILRTQADGTTCVMASGTNWRDGLPKEQLMGIPG